MQPLMIIRSNMESPDIMIEGSRDSLEARLERVLVQLRDPASPHHLGSDYLLLRLQECMARLLQSPHQVTTYMETVNNFCAKFLLLFQCGH